MQPFHVSFPRSKRPPVLGMGVLPLCSWPLSSSSISSSVLFRKIHMVFIDVLHTTEWLLWWSYLELHMFVYCSIVCVENHPLFHTFHFFWSHLNNATGHHDIVCLISRFFCLNWDSHGPCPNQYWALRPAKQKMIKGFKIWPGQSPNIRFSSKYKVWPAVCSAE